MMHYSVPASQPDSTAVVLFSLIYGILNCNLNPKRQFFVCNNSSYFITVFVEKHKIINSGLGNVLKKYFCGKDFIVTLNNMFIVLDSSVL